MIRYTIFDRWGTQKGTVQNVIDDVWADELGGEDSLTLTLPETDLIKGDRLVWRDRWGYWHEHIVARKTDSHANGVKVYEVYCESSLSEMLTDNVDELRPYDVGARVAITRALATTRWEVGTVAVEGTASASLYHTSVREALATIQDAWGGELWSTIEVAGTGVSARKVNLTTRGEDNGKRYEWSKDVEGITRQWSLDDVCTALYGYGKGVENYDDSGQWTGGYTRRVTFAEINGGKEYVEDTTARQTWGLPDGSGGTKHTFGRVFFDDVEDPAELLRLTREELERRKQPQVSYSATVRDLADAGYDFEDARAGDVVQVVDRELGVRVTGRVLRVERHGSNVEATAITLGNLTTRITDVLAQAVARVRSFSERAGTWDGAASISVDFLRATLLALNRVCNQSGGYVYVTEGYGLRTYDTPVSDPLVGSEANSVVEMLGGSIRIANTRDSNGNWEWKSVFVSGHIAAELVTAARLAAGFIGNANGTYWDLDNDVIHIGGSSDVGGRTVTQLLSDVDGAASAASDARRYATDYLNFAAGVGLDVGYSGSSAKTRTTTNGIEIFDGNGTSVGYFGVSGNNSVSRLGAAAGTHVVTSSEPFFRVYHDSEIIAHVGYGTVNYASATRRGPYYTFGTRASGSGIGWGSFASGDGVVASGDRSHAEGCDTLASEQFAHAEGWETQATGYCAHAEGLEGVASGWVSHAEGYGTQASGDAAHAEGRETEASGEGAHAEGYGTQASGDHSHASGYGTVAASQSQFVVGEYNAPDSAGKYPFIIGNGSSSSNRSDLLHITKTARVNAAVESPNETLLFTQLDSSRVSTSSGAFARCLNVVQARFRIGLRNMAGNPIAAGASAALVQLKDTANGLLAKTLYSPLMTARLVDANDPTILATIDTSGIVTVTPLNGISDTMTLTLVGTYIVAES